MVGSWINYADAEKVKAVKACVGELKVHGLVVESGNGQEFVVTERAACLIDDAMSQMRQRYPKASMEEVKVKALIFIVLHELSAVDEEFVPVYVGILSSLKK